MLDKNTAAGSVTPTFNYTMNMAPHLRKNQKSKSRDNPIVHKSSKKISKSMNQPNNAVKSEGLALQLGDEVAGFPRGRESSLTLRRCRELHKKEIDEEYWVEDHLRKKGKNRPRRSHEPADDLGSLSSDVITGKLPRYVNKITLKNISSGMKLCGLVTARILKVDEERHSVSLGMKDSYMNSESTFEIPLEQRSDEPAPDRITSKTWTNTSFLGEESMDIEDENDQCSILSQSEERASIPQLDVTLDDFNEFDGVNIHNGQNQEQVNEEGTIDEKQRRRAKKKEKEEREKEISAAEERLLEQDIPRTADEFEKLIRSSPNSSFLWIKYMDFMISMTKVEKARSIAERALKTINIREENEKFSIWKAYLNLENKYGSPKEDAVIKVFHRALQYNDPKKMHLALLGMYERTEQHDLADELVNKMTKKFKHSCKVWLRRIHRLLKENQDGIQAVVNRALLCLPRHKHIKFISQTAILEFKAGVPDRGRSLFERILREYPKRTDLWSVYLDREIHLKDADVIRALFERAISLSLPPKKMKFLYKKYLEYEKSQGDEKRIESVKRKAMEYVESTLA